MKTAGKWISLITALALCMSVSACGHKAEETEQQSTGTEIAASNPENQDDEAEEEEDDADDDAPIDKDELIIKGKSTTAPEQTASDAGKSTDQSIVQTVVSANASEKVARGEEIQSSAKNTQSKTDAKASTKITAANTKAAADVKTTPVVQTETEAVMTDLAPEPEAPPEENVVSGLINLTDGRFEGEGISVNGGTILITGEGTYILSGAWTGMVEINTIQKVKLKLNGVSITNPSGPAILCTDAKRLTITLIEGTYNSLTDGVNTAFDGAICSNDTVEIKGAGALNINATNEHGIASDDDLIIKNGDITVNAVKTGLMANDDITISGGTLHVTGATNGIKSKGTLHISGGTIFTTGGPKETKSALYSAGAFTLTGGYIYALGCGATDPDPGSSTQCAISAKFVPSLEAGSSAAVICGGIQYMREVSPYAFNTVFLSTPDIYIGQPFSVFGNDIEYGVGMSTSGLLTSVTAEQEN